MSLDRLSTIIGEIYSSAADERQWPQCLSSIGALLHGTSANLIYHHYRDPLRGSLEVAIGADPELYRWYREYGQTIDPWALAIPPGRFPVGSVVLGASVMDHARFARTEFYAAMGRRHDTTRVVVGVLEASPELVGVLSVNRGDAGEEFASRDERLLRVLVPHLRRAMGIRRRLRSLAVDEALLADAMDAANLGIVLVDTRARPIFVNGYARRILAARDGLVIDNEWRAATPSTTDRLRTALAQAIAVTNGESLESGDDVIGLPRAQRCPLRLTITPVSRINRLLDAPRRVAAIVFVVDPELVPVAPPERLGALFGLTPGEARVASAFAEARSVNEISSELGTTRETVRSHVKRVLAKAGVSTQAQFVRLVMTGVARLAGDPADSGH